MPAKDDTQSSAPSPSSCPLSAKSERSHKEDVRELPSQTT